MTLIATSMLTHIADWATEEVMTDTAELLRETRVPRAKGGFDITYPVADTTVCGVFDAGQPVEQVVAGQEVGAVLKKILFPLGTVVLGSDRILVNGITTYHIVDLASPDTYDVVVKVLARRATLVG